MALDPDAMIPGAKRAAVIPGMGRDQRFVRRGGMSDYAAIEHFRQNTLCRKRHNLQWLASTASLAAIKP